jgi:ankyrin repeat protein
MPLLDLPNELLVCFSEQLESEKDLNAFARANGRLYCLLNTYLYRRNVKWSGSSALLWAARQGEEATLGKLLKEKGNVRVKDTENRTPLSLAAENGYDAAVNLLLRNGANLEAKDKSLGWTPLAWAAWQGHSSSEAAT